MYVHFQDWSAPPLLEQLAARDMPHGDKIIKVFATDEDPRDALALPELVVHEGDPSPLHDEAFAYEGRDLFPGDEVEERLAVLGLGELGMRSIRTLFRFSHEHGFTHGGMAAETAEGWLIDHPLEMIDGIDKARVQPARERAVHLDLFFPETIEELLQASIVDHTNPNTMLDMYAGTRFLLRR